MPNTTTEQKRAELRSLGWRRETLGPAKLEVWSHPDCVRLNRGTGRRLALATAYKHRNDAIVEGKWVSADTDPAPAADAAAPWEAQRFDHSWGGFRAMPTAFDDDAPARFRRKQDAIDAVLIAAEKLAPFHSFRVYNKTTGVIVGFARQDGRLIVR